MENKPSKAAGNLLLLTHKDCTLLKDSTLLYVAFWIVADHGQECWDGDLRQNCKLQKPWLEGSGAMDGVV